MSDAVRERWLAFTEPLEGGVPCLYTDMRQTVPDPNGIVTIAYGNALFTSGAAAALPLLHPSGVPATAAEKVAAWQLVHDNPHARTRGWRYASTLTTIRLTREGMGALALAKYDSNDRILRARVPDWDDIPACARMALHSLAWACGANAHFPRLFAAVNARDFERAAVEVRMNEWTPEGTHNAGLVPRNIANKILLRNAGKVQAYKLDPDLLNWSTALGPDDAPPETFAHADPTYVDELDGGTRIVRPGDVTST